MLLYTNLGEVFALFQIKVPKFQRSRCTTFNTHFENLVHFAEPTDQGAQNIPQQLKAEKPVLLVTLAH